ncbi:MAG TPA: maleylpyruvate isomerase N-terminal domain-containing protein [Planosporangium sp.]|nr:maleylpyruvate isomerase N-terminal domain-containing protein [Planosporangium sp.]
MPTRDVYAATRTRLLDLASGLDDATAARSVPALPGWSIKDTYAHLAGVCADVLDDRRAPQPGWGERNVAERRDRSLAEVTAEWSARGSALDERLHGDEVFHLGVDAWSHEHDIRGALNLPMTTPAETGWVHDRLVTGFQAQWTKGSLPPIRFAVDGVEHLLGTGEPTATLRCDAFTLGRVLMGRRSRQQVAALDWSGDPEPVLDRLFVFGPAEADVDY